MRPSPHGYHDPAETSESYARRLGQFHSGRDAHRLLADMGIDIRDYLAGTVDAIGALAAKAGIEAAGLMAGTIRRLTRCREFRGERWSVDFVRPEGKLVCPQCLNEDAKEGQAWLRKGRITWRLRPVLTCTHHNCQLVQLCEDAEDPASVFEASGAVEVSTETLQAPTALEIVISNRIAGVKTGAGDWLDSQTIEQGVRCCEMIGATLDRGLTFSLRGLSPEDWRRAGGNGFEIARVGPDAVRGALTNIAAMSATNAGQAGPKAVYGRIFEWLSHTTPIVDHGPILGLLREQILDTMAVEPDEVLLGQRVVGRRLHSVHSLSVQMGLHRKRLRKILVQAGMTTDDSWDLAANRLVFPAAAAERLCRGIYDSVSLHFLPEVVGCTRTQAESLYREKVVQPVVDRDDGNGIGKIAFSRREVATFLGRIADLPDVPSNSGEVVNLMSACKRTGRSTGEIVARIFACSLRAYRIPGEASLEIVRIAVVDLDPVRVRPARIPAETTSLP